jgi:hypothetical protein
MRPRDIMCPQDVEPQVIVGRRRRTGSIFNTPTPTPTPSPSPNAVKMAAYHGDVGISPNQRPMEFGQQFPTLSPPQSVAALAFQFPDSPPTTDESADPGSPLCRTRDVSASTTTWPLHELNRTEGDFPVVWNGDHLRLNGVEHQTFVPSQQSGGSAMAAGDPIAGRTAMISFGKGAQLLQPTTLYVTGFPITASERECGHIFRAIPGFQSLNLCRKKSRYCGGSKTVPPSSQEHVIVFATFDNWFYAQGAIQYLRHYVVDPNLGSTSAPLRASFAKERSKSVCSSCSSL